MTSNLTLNIYIFLKHTLKIFWLKNVCEINYKNLKGELIITKSEIHFPLNVHIQFNLKYASLFKSLGLIINIKLIKSDSKYIYNATIYNANSIQQKILKNEISFLQKY